MLEGPIGNWGRKKGSLQRILTWSGAGRSEAVGFLVRLRSHLLGYLATIARLRFAAAEVGKKRKRAKKRMKEAKASAGPQT